MKDATQINTAIPLVVKSENYADRLTRWMEDEYWRDLMRLRTVEEYANRPKLGPCSMLPEPPK